MKKIMGDYEACVITVVQKDDTKMKAKKQK